MRKEKNGNKNLQVMNDLASDGASVCGQLSGNLKTHRLSHAKTIKL